MNILSHKDRQNAEEAYRILSSPVFSSALASVEKNITDQWKGCEKQEKRDALWRDLQSLYRVRGELTRMLEYAAFQTRENVFLGMLHKITDLYKK